jgi:hypothetical protein
LQLPDESVRIKAPILKPLVKDLLTTVIQNTRFMFPFGDVNATVVHR